MSVVESMAAQLEMLCEGRKNRAVRFQVSAIASDLFAKREMGSVPDRVDVTLTNSTRLSAFGMEVQGIVGGMPEPFVTSFVVERDGSIRWASTTQTPTCEHRSPNPDEDVMTFCDSDKLLEEHFSTLFQSLMEAILDRGVRVKDSFGRE